MSSDLVTDCFELTREIRVLHMRAASYDLSGFKADGRPFTPVRIEAQSLGPNPVETATSLPRAAHARTGSICHARSYPARRAR